MKAPVSLDQALSDLRRQDQQAPLQAERLLGQFHERLGKAPPAIRARTKLAWFFLPAAALGLVAVLALFFLPAKDGVRSSETAVRAVTAPRVSALQIKTGQAYRFEQAAHIEAVTDHELRVTAGSTLTLTARTESSMGWELKKGRVDVVHRTKGIFTNFFTAGPWVILEIGTAYSLSRGETHLEVAVSEGQVLARNGLSGESHVIPQGGRRNIPILADPQPAARLDATPKPARGNEVSLADLTAASERHATSRSFLHLVGKGRYQRYSLSHPALQSECAIELPSSTRGLFAVDDRLWALTTSEYLYTWNAEGERKSIRCGLVSGANLYAARGRWYVVNAEGEIQEYDEQTELRRRQKVLRGSLWEGVIVQDRYLVLPDLSGNLATIDLQNDFDPKELPIAGQINAPLTLGKGGVRVPLESGVVEVAFGDLGIPMKR
jgi:hypothetical protein